MNHRFPIFIIVLSTLIGIVYSYVAFSMTDVWSLRILIAVPFLAIWLMPVVYWSRTREGHTAFDQGIHTFAFLSMAWVSFVLVMSLIRDMAIAIFMAIDADFQTLWMTQHGAALVLTLSILAVLVGGLQAASGPKVIEVDIAIEDLPPALDGFRIVQISDLHVSSMIRRPYVERVKEITNKLNPDLVALTGDIIDGPLSRLMEHAAPLKELLPKGRVIFVTGNHEYYSGAPEWIEHFKSMGMTVLQNSYVAIEHNGTEMMVAGIVDPAVTMIDPTRRADPDLASRTVEFGSVAKNPSIKILLAHNPKITGAAAKVGFDLQLSGHTHAGQFFPWTLAVRLVHAPHYAGLSRAQKMWVYVSAGTGTWGPPVRLGTTPELTLLRLVRS
jgi:predicted MPP superfamily phosphohydrolase